MNRSGGEDMEDKKDRGEQTGEGVNDGDNVREFRK